MFKPETNQYPYPEDTSGHYGTFSKNRGIIFDKDYPYVDYSKGFAFKRWWVRLLLRLIVFPMAKWNLGLRVIGKENLKKHKEVLKHGAVTVCNHVHPWDYICIMKALHNIKWPYTLSIGENINDKSGPLVRFVGGIPIPPKEDESAQIAFKNAVYILLNKGNFLQFYAEGSLWDYYSYIRPFKRGAASYAVKTNKPILPMVITYREPGKIRKKLIKQVARFDLHVGEPIFANSELSGKEQIDDLTRRAHQAVVALAGLEKENIYLDDIYTKK